MSSVVSSSSERRLQRAPSLTSLLILSSVLVTGLGGASTAAAGKCPNVQILLDRSGSMTAAMSSGGTRWSAATQGITKWIGLVEPLRPARVGLTMFPNMLCDSLTPVLPDYLTSTAITAAMAATGPSGSTPTATAVRDIAALSALKDPTRKQYIILLTDGGPGCGVIDTPAGTVNEITVAKRATPSIGTFVVGVGDGLSASEQSTLGLMADAGGYPDSTAARYYKGTTAAALDASMTSIVMAILAENTGCSDATPADMGMPPRDMSMPPRDLAVPPADMSEMPGPDMAMTMPDMAMTMLDMAMTMPDMAMTMPDLSELPPDLSMMPPRDMSGMPPRDLSDNMSKDMAGMPPVDLAETPGMDLADSAKDMAGSGNSDGGVITRPVIQWIAPNKMEQGKTGPAVIHGLGFAATATVYFEDQSHLVTVTNVLVENEQVIKIAVPSDLPASEYNVIVKNPDGALDRLNSGFTITPAATGGCACQLGASSAASATTTYLVVAAAAALLLVRRAQRRRHFRI